MQPEQFEVSSAGSGPCRATPALRDGINPPIVSNVPARARSRLAALLSLFPHFYALRIPILLAVTLAGLPALSFWTDAEPMLAGLYDIAPSGMLVLTMLNFTAAWTLLLTSWMILAYAPARLKCAALSKRHRNRLALWFLWSAALALPNIVTAIVLFAPCIGRQAAAAADVVRRRRAAFVRAPVARPMDGTPNARARSPPAAAVATWLMTIRRSAPDT